MAGLRHGSYLPDQIQILNVPAESYEAFMKRLLKHYVNGHSSLSGQVIPGTFIGTYAQDFLLDLLVEIRNLYNCLAQNRQAVIQIAMYKFSLFELTDNYDIYCFTLAVRLMKGMYAYVQSTLSTNLIQEGSVLAYVFHPVTGFLCATYNTMEEAMIHLMGKPIKLADPKQGQQLLVVIYANTSLPPQDPVLGVGWMYIQFTDNTVTAMQGNADESILNELWNTNTDANLADLYIFSHLIPMAIHQYMNYGKLGMVSDRDNVLEFELVRASDKTEKQRGQHAKVLQNVIDLKKENNKLVELTKQQVETIAKIENESKIKIQQVTDQNNKMMDYMMTHNVLDNYIQGTPPGNKYREDARNSVRVIHQQNMEISLLKTKSHESDQQNREKDKHISTLIGKLRKSEQDETKKSEELFLITTIVNATNRQLEETKVDLEATRGTITTAKEELTTMNKEKGILLETIREMEETCSRLTEEINRLRLELRQTTKITSPVSPISVMSSPQESHCDKLSATLSNTYSEAFSTYVMKGTFGAFIRNEYYSNSISSEDAAYEFAYMCWARDDNTTFDGKNWDQTKLEYSTLLPQALNSKLKNTFVITHDELVEFTRKSYSDTIGG